MRRTNSRDDRTAGVFRLSIVDNTIRKATKISSSYNARETPVINSLHARTVCNRFISARTSATHARELVDVYPTVHVPGVAWRHAQCVAPAPHAYTCRADRDLCHWLRSVASSRLSAVPRVRIERTRTARHHLPIYRRTANGIGDLSRLLIAATFPRAPTRILFFVYESYSSSRKIFVLEDCRNFIAIDISVLRVQQIRKE